MRGSSGQLTLAAIWNELVSKGKNRLGFYDEFNRGVVDAETWTPTLDGGGTWAPLLPMGLSEPSSWRLRTGNVIDNDSMLLGNGLIRNKIQTFSEEGYTTLTYETRIRFDSIADISVIFGLYHGGFAGYIEVGDDILQFLIDPAITATFRARTFRVAEEETDTLVALDTDWHKFKMIWTSASVLFYIDDVLVATHVTRVPLQAGYPHFIIRTEAAANKGMHIDYLRIEHS